MEVLHRNNDPTKHALEGGASNQVQRIIGQKYFILLVTHQFHT
jgi:hypothetical protein